MIFTNPKQDLFLSMDNFQRHFKMMVYERDIGLSGRTCSNIVYQDTFSTVK